MACNSNMDNKKIIVFDLDGTLTTSKSQMDIEMAELLARLLAIKDVAVMSGAHLAQYQKQFLNCLNLDSVALARLHLLPTCGASWFDYKNGWQNIYKEELTSADKEKIINAFNKVLNEVGHNPEKVFGEMLEDRGGTQISFSALGQLAPHDLKKDWDPSFGKRLAMKVLLDKEIPEFDVKVAGTTSIDVTKKGIDKAHGIKKIESVLGFRKQEMLFVGDDLRECGNDAMVIPTGIQTKQVASTDETAEVIEEIVELCG